MNRTKARIRFPIGLKLILIISAIVLVSFGTLTILVSHFVGSDVRLTAEENNLTINRQSALSAESSISTIRSDVFLLLDMQNAAGASGALGRQAAAFFFERNQNIAAIVIPGASELFNNRYFVSNEIETSLVQKFLDAHKDEIKRSEAGETIALNAAPVFDLPVLVFLFPWREGGYDQTAAVFFSGEALTESFGAGSTNQSFMINDKDEILVHPDFELVKNSANMGKMALVGEMRKNNDQNRQILFKNTDGKDYFGAYTRLSIADIGVLTIEEKDKALETVNTTLINNLRLALVILALAILFIGIYSRTISRPLRALTDASQQIEEGNFDVELKSRSNDEIGVLAQSFVQMGKGLKEREHLKDAFGRFTNKAIAERAARGELNLGGETKDVTVFFSDIRSFTEISEKLQPFEVVEFLNAYMTRMVDCVVKTDGVVDKFIGDAIMAVWGSPQSAGSPKADALNAVRAALFMRASLIEFNKDRGGDKKPIIRIGCGINSGPVIAGQIGSKSRMEYTCIGDAVNFASRTESLNKPLCTDILITEDTYNLVKDEVEVEVMPTVTVKGKAKPQHMYAVVNMPGATDIPMAGANGPKSLNEIRKLLGKEIPDLGKVNLDDDEKKYKIQQPQQNK